MRVDSPPNAEGAPLDELDTMGCNASISSYPGDRGPGLASYKGGRYKAALVFNDSKVKSRLRAVLEQLTKDDQSRAALGLPSISRGQVTLDDLPVDLLDLHQLLASSSLTCYEDVNQGDYLEVPYSKVTGAMFQRTVALSWRWHAPKPLSKKPGFSPMSSNQVEELLSILQEAQKQGMEYVWIDWSCVVQYNGDPMVEIQRSRLYYMRCGAFIVVSTFDDIPDSGPVKIVLVKVIRALKKIVADKGEEKSMVEQALVKIVEVILEKNSVASLEYFGRAWTLAERMSRSRPEALCQWMSLLTWIGMVIDAMLKSTADKTASAIYRTILRQEGSSLLDLILEPLAVAVETGSTMHPSMEGLEANVIKLYLAAKIWTCSNIPQEMPTRAWLQDYLLVNLGSGVYKAWDKTDLIWAIYPYFTWKTPVKTVAGVLEAIYDLGILAGLPRPADGSKILPDLLSTYKALGLNEAVGTIERAQKKEANHLRKAEDARKAEVARIGTEEARKRSEVLKAAEAAKIKYPSKPLVTAAKEKDEVAVLALIAAGYQELEEKDTNGWTALIWAAVKGQEGCLKALMDAGASKDARDSYGATALMNAAINGEEACVKMLVKGGADRTIKAKDGRMAVDKARSEAIKAILRS